MECCKYRRKSLKHFYVIFVQFFISTHCFLCPTKLSMLIVRLFFFLTAIPQSLRLPSLFFFFKSVFLHNSGRLGQYHFPCWRKARKSKASKRADVIGSGQTGSDDKRLPAYQPVGKAPLGPI